MDVDVTKWPPIGHRFITALCGAGLKSPADVVIAGTDGGVAALLGLSIFGARDVIQACAQHISPAPLSAYSVYRAELRHVLKTPLAPLDEALLGGLRALSEVSGAAGTGKTQFCLSCVVRALVDPAGGGGGSSSSSGGADVFSASQAPSSSSSSSSTSARHPRHRPPSVLYIDTERTFDPSRVAEIAAALYPHLFAPLSRAGDSLRSAVYGLLDATTDASDAGELPVSGAAHHSRSGDAAGSASGVVADCGGDVAMRGASDPAATLPATAASSGGGGVWGSSRVENTRTLLSMITVHAVDTTAQLTRLLAQMEGWSWSSHHNVRMVVLDSVAAFARRELESLASASASAAAAGASLARAASAGSGGGGGGGGGSCGGGGGVGAPMSTMERVAVLARLSAVLKATAETLQIPVVVTNQITTTRATTGRGIGGGLRGHDADEDIDAEALLAATNADSSIETILAPALGVTWAHAVNTRLYLTVGSGGRGTGVVTILKSPVAARASFPYAITAAGWMPPPVGHTHAA